MSFTQAKNLLARISPRMFAKNLNYDNPITKKSQKKIHEEKNTRIRKSRVHVPLRWVNWGNLKILFKILAIVMGRSTIQISSVNNVKKQQRDFK